ncbi:MAG: SusC/RagA family TonB-linked outer membrane protein [Bacteroidales bacterium]|nr:SusC/RagA family TonB-linked outer membrane protein [Bacteroidales bacterium]
MNKFILLLLFIGISLLSFSQVKIQGKVIDEATNETLPGVTVVIMGTTNGVITNGDGFYSIEANASDTLIFSFIGFEDYKVNVGIHSKINVYLKSDIVGLNEVVITALDIKRDKASLGYSVSAVGADEVNIAKDNNVMNSLSGKVSGLQVNSGSSGVDGSSRILLRGITTIEGSNRPLVVIDGIPISSGGGGGGPWGGVDRGDAMSDINPDDIESMSILKGAGASAAYGSLGMHGVILITTKSGSKKGGVGVSYGLSVNSTHISLTPELQSEYGMGAFGQFSPIGSDGMPSLDYPYSWSYGPKMEGQEYTNWLGKTDNYTSHGNPYTQFYQSGLSVTNSLALQSSSDKGSFRLSVTDQRGDGIVKYNTIKRQTYNLRASANLTDKFTVDGKVTYIKSRVENRPEVAEGSANTSLTLGLMPRDISLEDAENYSEDENGNDNFWHNDPTFSGPFWSQDHVKNYSLKDRFQGMFSAKLDINKHFWITGKTGLDYNASDYTSYADRGSKAQTASRGNYSNSMGLSTIWNSDILATYQTNIKKLSITASLGSNYRESFGSYIGVAGWESKTDGLYNISNYIDTRSSNGSWGKLVYSFYGLGQFSYDNYLYFDATLRNDHSSALPESNDSYWYHSENLSLLFTKLLGMDSHVLNSGKIRASYAKVGNDTGPYRTEYFYNTVQTQTLPYPIAAIPSSLPAIDLRPEITHSWEVGTDLSFLGSRINLDLTYYQSESVDQIMSIPISGTSGFSSKVINAGSISNKGLEIQLNTTPVIAGDFSWDLGLNYTKSSSMVNELSEGIESIVLNRLWTVSVEARPGEEFGAIYGNDFLRNKTGDKLITDGGHVQRGERIKLGSMNPDFYGGITNNFSYKNLSLRTLISYQMGGEFYSHGRYYRMLWGTDKRSLEGRENGIIVEGINENTGYANTVPVSPLAKNFTELYLNEITADYILDATNVKLKEVIITYTFSRSLLAKTFIQGASVSLVGRDLFFIYNAAGDIDPQSGYSSTPTGVALEHSSLPSTRTFGFDLKINF